MRRTDDKFSLVDRVGTSGGALSASISKKNIDIKKKKTTATKKKSQRTYEVFSQRATEPETG